MLNINIYDISGKNVYSKQLNPNSLSLNTGSFTNGIYMLKVNSTGNIYRTQKFIIR